MTTVPINKPGIDDQDAKDNSGVRGSDDELMAMSHGRFGLLSRRSQWWNHTLGPVRTAQGTVTLRPPHISDANAWRELRLSNESRLCEAFPSHTPVWADGQSKTMWAERAMTLRTAARRGLALPFVVIVDGAFGGEYGIDSIDSETATGEQSGWLAKKYSGAAIASVSVALAVLHAFAGPRPLQRIIGPNAVDLPAAGVLLAGLGYQRETVLTGLREGTSGRKDHEIWVIHNTPHARARLNDVLLRRRVE